jgi:ABC-type multidrug transport system ATPase subunit
MAARTNQPPDRALLQLTAVSRSYGDRLVLDSISLRVRLGECVVLVGDNGSGKSTLLRVASGREMPSSGTVLFDGEPIDEDSLAVRARIATVMDSGAYYPDLTVREHLMLAALAHGLGADADAAVETVLEEHRLTDHANVLPSALSSGQTQALLLAAAFVRPHDVLILDEPEQRLDTHARQELAQRLAVHRDGGIAVIVATHHHSLSAIADRVFALDGGEACLGDAGGTGGRPLRARIGTLDLARRTIRPLSSTRSEQTDHTLAYLCDARSELRQQRRKSAALAAYGITLVGAMWGGPALIAATKAGRISRHHGVFAEQVWTSLPAMAPALLLLTLLFMARGAMWRGPVLLDMPTVSWLLPTPVARAPLLRSRLWASVLLAGSAGLVLGGASGFLLYGLTATSWVLLTAAGAWAGAVVALTGSALGALVECYASWMARHAATFFGIGWAVVAVSLAAAVVSTLDGGVTWLEQVLLWSGPWGWAVQPLVATTGVQAPGWSLAAALSLGTVLATLVLSSRELPNIPQSALRLRATVASQVSASLFMLDLRQARSGVPALRERGSRPALRLPMPRRSWLVMPWRDATGLLRAPGRLGWAAVWVLIAVGLTVVAPTLGATAQRLAVVITLVAEYLAAAQLTETARLESDDIRRSANLPCTAKTMATWHTVVPSGLLIGALGLAAAACVLGGWAVPGLVPLIASAPALVMASLVSSYRGVMPAHVLIGTNTPMGNTGPFQAALWYLRGSLTALLLTAPVLIAVTHGAQYGTPQLLWHVLLSTAGLWWVRRTAHRLHSG